MLRSLAMRSSIHIITSKRKINKRTRTKSQTQLVKYVMFCMRISVVSECVCVFRKVVKINCSQTRALFTRAIPTQTHKHAHVESNTSRALITYLARSAAAAETHTFAAGVYVCVCSSEDDVRLLGVCA